MTSPALQRMAERGLYTGERVAWGTGEGLDAIVKRAALPIHVRFIPQEPEEFGEFRLVAKINGKFHIQYVRRHEVATALYLHLTRVLTEPAPDALPNSRSGAETPAVELAPVAFSSRPAAAAPLAAAVDAASGTASAADSLPRESAAPIPTVAR
jgi:hypothetical protein